MQHNGGIQNSTLEPNFRYFDQFDVMFLKCLKLYICLIVEYEMGQGLRLKIITFLSRVCIGKFAIICGISMTQS